jgi:hypothetical protein
MEDSGEEKSPELNNSGSSPPTDEAQGPNNNRHRQQQREQQQRSHSNIHHHEEESQKGKNQHRFWIHLKNTHEDDASSLTVPKFLKDEDAKYKASLFRSRKDKDKYSSSSDGGMESSMMGVSMPEMSNSAYESELTMDKAEDYGRRNRGGLLAMMGGTLSSLLGGWFLRSTSTQAEDNDDDDESSADRYPVAGYAVFQGTMASSP